MKKKQKTISPAKSITRDTRLKQQVKQLSTLQEISLAMNTTLNTDKLLFLIIDEAIKAIGANSGSIILIDHDKGTLNIKVGIGLDQKTVRKMKLRLGEGVTGWVAEHGKPLRVPDVTKDERYVNVRADVRSELAVPLIHDDRVIGVINLDSDTEDAFSREDEELLCMLAGHAGLVLRNADLFFDLREKSRHLSRLLEASKTAVSSLKYDEVLNSILRQAAELVNTKIASLLLIDEEKQELYIRAVYGADEEYSDHPGLKIDESLSGKAVLKKKAMIFSDIRRERKFVRLELAEKSGLVSLISVPLIVHDEVIGVLNCYTARRKKFSKFEIETLTTFAGISAIALENARLFENIVSVKTQRDQVMASMNEGLITVDAAGVITSINQSGASLLELIPEDILGRSLEEIDRLRPLAGALHVLYRSPLPHDDLQFEFSDANGQKVFLKASLTVIRDEDEIPVGGLAVFRNLTRLRHLEQEVRSSERLASLGLLAAGVAHEIRNPLGSIRGAAQLLNNELKTNDDRREYADLIIHETDRLDKVIESLLDFAKPSLNDLALSDLNELIEHTLILVRAGLKDRPISISTSLAEELPPIKIDYNSIKQVIFNVILNAVQAIPETGEIKVTSELIGKEKNSVEGVSIYVVDTGVGMDADTMSNLFNPFFTTRSEGTGLGLAISRGIVEQHGGYITAQSTPDEGSVFEIFLPFKRKRTIK